MKDGRLPALVDPKPTADERLDAFAREVVSLSLQKQKEGEKRPDSEVIPGIDVAQLRRDYGPEQGFRPHSFKATFRVPLGMTWNSYEKRRNQAVKAFVQVMDKKGYDLYAPLQIQVTPGQYPAFDVDTQAALFDEREFVIRAHFIHRKPKTVRIELPSHLVEPKIVRA